jgi:hypothetical protein
MPACSETLCLEFQLQFSKQLSAAVTVMYELSYQRQSKSIVLVKITSWYSSYHTKILWPYWEYRKLIVNIGNLNSKLQVLLAFWARHWQYFSGHFRPVSLYNDLLWQIIVDFVLLNFFLMVFLSDYWLLNFYNHFTMTIQRFQMPISPTPCLFIIMNQNKFNSESDRLQPEVWMIVTNVPVVWLCVVKCSCAVGRAVLEQLCLEWQGPP